MPDADHNARRERPWLIPSNRKIRHLQAITLRNLALSHESNRPRRGTIDDEGLPATKKSPAKMLALRDAHNMNHSKSSDDLRPIHETNISLSPTPTKPRTPPRPSFAKLRRRSTLEWAASTSQQRQRRLQDVSAQRMADLFYSIHIPNQQDPIYVSEVAEKVMNPNFRNIHFDSHDPQLMRLDELTLKFWAKSEAMSNYSLLIDMTLSMRSLQFIGKSLSSFHHPFPPNCVVFHLTDGFYTAFTDARVDEPVDPFRDGPAKTTSSRTLTTSSFDALLRLSKLDDSVQDALALRKQLASELERTLQENQTSLSEKTQLAETTDFLKTIDFATVTVKKQLKVLQQKRDQKRKALQSRRDLLTRDSALRKKVLMQVEEEEPAHSDLTSRHNTVKASITQQRRRVTNDLSKIYPITPLPDQSLAFTIRGVHLPNSEALDAATPESLAAALGHVGHVIQLLSLYLGAVLPYPCRPRSSTSTIIDPISILTSTTPSKSLSTAENELAARTFPLFSKGAVRFRFEYGVFLLNKNVEILLSTHFGVRVLDIRQTLPNLLYVFYCATAGDEELPARKAGGVRGLMRMRQG
ncbi:hypothetical protein D6C78_03181 [Aureobasidium pullulans]|uniref:Autophagy-related protein 14 n=1 Tax=Aureobasidium pullulans TaxID=5580 RepID=A0A4T0C253_AURPU|nr:hypothetical protein D6C78_03181 [Aureobasidium pullulans]